ncbi:hypothetical protein Lal_00004380 [Lupinus albus]|nr:hypothetical protein Lal_00004380 [Lupinus albus]
MPSAPSKLYSDDVSLLVVTLDTNPFFWSTFSVPFSDFLSQVLAFLNSILLLSQLNQLVVIATGCNSCGYVYDSASSKNHVSPTASMPALYSNLLHNLEQFVARDQKLSKPDHDTRGIVPASLLSGSLSMSLCCILLIDNCFILHLLIILCLQGSADGPEQYVAIMNAIFSAQRSTVCTKSSPFLIPVPIDSCYIGSNNSAFLQQASYITGGIYYKPPQLDGLFQYLSTVFATDLHSRAFLRLPKSVGVDFRASYAAICTLSCILVLHYYGRDNKFVNLSGAFAISKQLTWAMYVLYAYPYSVSVMISVQLADLYLARLKKMLPQLIARKEKLDNTLRKVIG